MLAAVGVGGVVGLLLLATQCIHLRRGFARRPAVLLGALVVFALAALP